MGEETALQESWSMTNGRFSDNWLIWCRNNRKKRCTDGRDKVSCHWHQTSKRHFINRRTLFFTSSVSALWLQLLLHTLLGMVTQSWAAYQKGCGVDPLYHLSCMHLCRTSVGFLSPIECAERRHLAKLPSVTKLMFLVSKKPAPVCCNVCILTIPQLRL